MPVSRYFLGQVPWYSILILSGACLAILIGSRLERPAGLPKDTILDLALRVLPAGILGARIYYVIFSWDDFRNDVGAIFRIWEGGLAIYGGLLAGGLTVLLFCRRRKLPVMTVLDIIVPGLALAQAIGRWGNFFNMEAYGWTVQDPALCFFPFAVLIPENGRDVWHLATFFYESCWNLLNFLLLMFHRRRQPAKGESFRLYLLLYAAGRLIIEELREDSLYTGGIRVSQLLSIAAVLVLVLWRIVKALREKEASHDRLLLLLPMAGQLLVSGWVLGLALKLPFFPALTAPRSLIPLALFSLHSLLASGWVAFLTGSHRRR